MIKKFGYQGTGLICYMLALMVILIVYTPGCNKPSDAQIDSTIDATAPLTINVALVHFDKKSPATTKQAASLISQAADDGLQLLQSNALPASQFLPLLEQTLLKKVPADYEGVVVTVLGFVGNNVNVNAPAMSDVEKAHFQHALTAIKKGCDLYLKGKVAHLYEKPTDLQPIVNAGLSDK